MNINQLVTTLLWSASDDDGNPLDSGDYEASEELKTSLAADFQVFLDSLPEGFDAEDHYTGSADIDGMLEHHYILTRNGHGTGFWDGAWGKEMGNTLTELAQRKSEIETYVGDDGLVYAL
jgi:hypothetical protein